MYYTSLTLAWFVDRQDLVWACLFSLKLRGEASIDTSSQEESLGGTCTLPGAAFRSLRWPQLCGVGHIHLLCRRLKGKAAAQIWAEAAAWQAHVLLKQRRIHWRLKEGKRGMLQFCGAGTTGGPPGLFPLSIVWVMVPVPNRSVSCIALALFC